jgi:hypothetical protein
MKDLTCPPSHELAVQYTMAWDGTSRRVSGTLWAAVRVPEQDTSGWSGFLWHRVDRGLMGMQLIIFRCLPRVKARQIVSGDAMGMSEAKEGS